MTILLHTDFPAAFRESLAERLPLLGPCPGASVAELPEAVRATIRVIVTMGTLKVDASLLDRLPALGLVCNYGSGFEGTERGAAERRGILVSHSPGANASSVADLAMGLLIAACRRIGVADRLVRAGRWTNTGAERMPSVRGLTGRRLGIFGLGDIGGRIARRAEAFEMEVGYHNRTRRTDVAYPWFESLGALADWADVLVVAARADAGNRHIVGRDILCALGPDGILVNIGRGSLVDETALVAALQAGELGSAGLDVYEKEPNVPEALRALDQVVLTPHIAAGSFEAQAAMGKMVLANIDSFLAGHGILTPVPRLAGAPGRG